MTMFFAKKLNKKGFTLAEMLIVVAIIAILVAIAVPLFTSQLDKAKVARDEANMRAVKSAAIVVILNNDKIDLNTHSKFYVTATVAKNGDIELVSIEDYSNQAESTPGKIDYSTTKNVNVIVKDVDISDASIVSALAS